MARRTRANDWTRRVSSDPGVCHGKPCIKGTRVLVSSILGSLAEGCSREQILEGYPTISGQDIDAALAYAAELTAGRSTSV